MVAESRIYLTGFMGSGKSTLGPRLAAVLGYSFLDLDEVIATKAGRSIQTIFETDGEAFFRDLETETLKEAGAQDRVVVALGGGALATEDNLQTALRTGVVVYLSASEDTLVRRLVASGRSRPLLSGGEGRLRSESSIRSIIRDLMAKREHSYRRAPVQIITDEMSVDESVQKLLKALDTGDPGMEDGSNDCT